jgi:hypothetical protein
VQINRVAAQAGQVLEKADELGDRLFVVISGDAQLRRSWFALLRLESASR